MNSWLKQPELSAAPSEQYNTGNLSVNDFLDEMRQMPESFGQDPSEDDLGLKGQNPIDATDDPSGMPMMPGDQPMGSQDAIKAKYTAKFAVAMMDTGIGNSCKMIARAPSAKPYQATPEEKGDLNEVWAEYLKTIGGDIPPGVLAFMMTSVVYGPRIGQAFVDRHLQEKISEQQKEMDRLREENATLKRKAA